MRPNAASRGRLGGIAGDAGGVGVNRGAGFETAGLAVRAAIGTSGAFRAAVGAEADGEVDAAGLTDRGASEAGTRGSVTGFTAGAIVRLASALI